MELVEVDTQHAYDRIREKIITLEIPPGKMINEPQLADDLDMGASPVREALKLLAHDELIVITPRHGLYVADINLTDLEQISEVRLTLEPLCAGLAARRATSDDLTVLEALRKEQAATSASESRRLLDVDHKFHQAIVQAAKNKHLIRILEHLFGLSQRLWYLALPQIDMLPTAVAEHLELVTSIKERNVERARKIMYHHVKEFYDRVRSILKSTQRPDNNAH
jgi:DNA-binding GntR family transcriptional regulator